MDLKRCGGKAEGNGKVPIVKHTLNKDGSIIRKPGEAEFTREDSKKLMKIADKMEKNMRITEDICDGDADVHAGLKDITCWCIEEMTQKGETALVFLPGVHEIVAMQEVLVDWKSPSGKSLNVMSLHRLIPIYDQKLAARDADSDKVNVILATNVAESSVTFGNNLTLIIDYCLQKRSKYSYERRVDTLGTGWASQAACTQRAGRTGRTCAG